MKKKEKFELLHKAQTGNDLLLIAKAILNTQKDKK